jgi:flavin-dependent dehydrogenase
VATGECYDVVIVGGRCAGSPLATHLARAGLSVAVLDRARFPSDVISTHVFQRGAIESLHRLGLLDQVRATGAPRIGRAIAPMDDGVDLSIDFESGGPGELEMGMCVRRILLDPILVDAAREAGAEVRTSTKVRGLLRDDDGRVVGVQADGPDGTTVDVRAQLVVGADGVASTVGSLVGARRYNLIPNARFYQYAYYAGARVPEQVPIVFHRRRYELGFACPTNEGQVIITVGPHFAELPAWRRDPGRGFDAEVAKMEDISDLVAGATRVTEPKGVVKATAYFREATGPGWVLVGDAGHFKDPTPGQGIADALRQAEHLAPQIVSGLGEDRRRLDRRLHDYGRWRDKVSAQRHWWASDIALPGKVSPVSLEVLRRLAATPAGRRRFWDTFLQRCQPRDALRPYDAMLATAALLRRPGVDRAEVLADSRRLAQEEWARNRAVRHPRYERDGRAVKTTGSDTISRLTGDVVRATGPASS